MLWQMKYIDSLFQKNNTVFVTKDSRKFNEIIIIKKFYFEVLTANDCLGLNCIRFGEVVKLSQGIMLRIC